MICGFDILFRMARLLLTMLRAGVTLKSHSFCSPFVSTIISIISIISNNFHLMIVQNQCTCRCFSTIVAWISILNLYIISQSIPAPSCYTVSIVSYLWRARWSFGHIIRWSVVRCSKQLLPFMSFRSQVSYIQFFISIGKYIWREHCCLLHV